MFILMSFSIFPRSGKKWKISFFDLSLGCTSKYFPTSYKKLRNKNLGSILDFMLCQIVEIIFQAYHVWRSHNLWLNCQFSRKTCSYWYNNINILKINERKVAKFTWVCVTPQTAQGYLEQTTLIFLHLSLLASQVLNDICLLLGPDNLMNVLVDCFIFLIWTAWISFNFYLKQKQRFSVWNLTENASFIPFQGITWSRYFEISLEGAKDLPFQR